MELKPGNRSVYMKVYCVIEETLQTNAERVDYKY